MLPKSIAIGLVVLLAACASTLDPELASRHVLAVDPEGRPVQPSSGETMDEGEFAAYVGGILRAADMASDDRRVSSTLPCPNPRHQHPAGELRRIRKILIHVHGGMNTRGGSLASAKRVIPLLEKEQGEDWNYPIFLSWMSGPLSSYWEHLVLLRNGDHYPLWGAISSPFFLGTDLLRGVAVTPRTWFYEFSLDARVSAKVIGMPLPEWQRADLIAAYLENERNAGREPEFDAVLGEYSRPLLDRTWGAFLWVLTVPLKLIVTPLFLDGMGQPAWDVMQHRAINTLHLADQIEWDGDDDARQTIPAVLGSEARGGFAQFLRQLDAHILEEESRTGVCYEVTAIGHSMGAMIWNDALRLFPGLPIRDVVYMGAACSVLDAERNLVPYLESHPVTNFYNLTLHPIAEAEEVNVYELPSRGSLLEWIDNWYSRPTNMSLKRLGKWLVSVQTLYMFKSVRDQYHLKGFGRRPGSKPAAHGEFNDCPFWRHEFRDPQGPLFF